MDILYKLFLALFQTIYPLFYQAILLAPAVIIGFTLHEYAHAWTAVHLGDPTPKLQGRLTLDPRRHLDIIGTLLVFLVYVGWAKPVQWQPANLRIDRRRGSILVAAAGPLMNLFLAVVAAIPIKMGWIGAYPHQGFVPGLNSFLSAFVLFNVLLFVFNLIPLPPLDGFSILENLLSAETVRAMEAVRQYGPLVLILLLFLPGSPVGRFIGMMASAVMIWLTGQPLWL